MVQTCEMFRYYNKLYLKISLPLFLWNFYSILKLQRNRNAFDSHHFLFPHFRTPLKIQGNAKDHYYQPFRRIYYCTLSIRSWGLLGNEIVPYFFISLDYTNPSVDDLNSRLGHYLYYVHRVANIKPAIAISHLLYYLDQNEIKRYYVDDPVLS